MNYVISDKAYAQWLSESLGYMDKRKVEKLALIGIDRDTGEIITGYYNCLMSDKAVMAANIQADAIFDSVMANADSIVQKAEEIAENEGIDET